MYDTSSGCYHLVVQHGQHYSSFLYDGDQVMSGTLCNLFVYKRELDLLFGSLQSEIKGISSQNVIILGVKYQTGNVIRVSGNNHEKFVYHIIHEILVFEDKKIFIVKPLKVIEFSKKFCAYE
ncbi:PREDICTED: uncharacterized protein LOC109592511, partial [Amphimedon queenslandica]|uniref:Uncharacterized protein n=1 Tax=Amphimedon queenslandica TaxID=400682 RepID=A0AAN0K1V1_AMPQE